MALTKKQLNQLNGILGNLQRGYDYLNAPNVQGIAIESDEKRVNGGDYKIINENACEVLRQPMYITLRDNQIGSDIAGFSFALSQLKNFIEMNSK